MTTVIPKLNEQYFPSPTPAVMIFENIDAVAMDDETDFVFDFLIENTTADDLLTEIDEDDFSIILDRRPDRERPERRWLSTAVGMADDVRESPLRFVTAKESKAIVRLRIKSRDLREACQLLEDGRKRDAATPGFDDVLWNLYLRADVFFRSRAERGAFDRMLDSGICTNRADRVPDVPSP